MSGSVLSIFSPNSSAVKDQESLAIRSLRMSATAIGAVWAVGQALLQVEMISKIANETFENFPLHYLQYAGKAAVVVRGGFAAKSLWTWYTKPTKAKVHLSDIVRRLIRAKNYHRIFQEMAKKQREKLDTKTYTKIVDLNNQFTNIAPEGYVDKTLNDLLNLARKTLIEIASQTEKIEPESPEGPPAKKQKIGSESKKPEVTS